MPTDYERITTTIEREWLAEIIAGTKKIEYRQIKPYWTKRFAKVSVPFELRLLNGMNPPGPEVTVLIHRITKDRRAGEYRLHIKKVLGFKHWDSDGKSPSGDPAMYDLINQYAQKVVGTIPTDHVTEYEWLIQNVNHATTPGYQNRYRRFWAMNAARLNPTFYVAYFGAMNAAVTQTPTLGALAQTFHAASTNSKGRQKPAIFIRDKAVAHDGPAFADIRFTGCCFLLLSRA